MQQGLGRDATDVEADTAKRGIAFDQHHRQAKIGGTECRRIATGTGAKHQDIATDICRSCKCRGSRCRCNRGLGRRACRRRRHRRCHHGGSPTGGRLFEHQYQRALRHLVAHLDADFPDHPRMRRGNFYGRLVRLEREQRLLLLDPVAGLDQHLDHIDILEIADIGNLYFNQAHDFAFSLMALSGIGAAELLICRRRISV